MKLILYGLDSSPPVRAVLLTLKALELPFDYVEVNLLDGEHKTADYLAKNPAHTVPMLEDDGNFISDSHAIMGYLVSQHGQQDSLYPKDPLLRALVDQRLHFENGVLFHSNFKQLQRLLFKEQVSEIPKENIAELHEVYKLLDSFLADNLYLAGDRLTIADFSIVATLSSLHLSYAPVQSASYPNLSAWLTRLSQLPYYEEANLKGAQKLAERVQRKLPKQFDKLWQKAFVDIKSGAGKQ